MNKRTLRLLFPVLPAVATVLLISSCATTDEAYFLNTESKANVFVAPVPCPIWKVAVMPFKAPTELIGSSVSDMFVTEMLRAGRYELVERSQMSKVLNEAELSLAGLSVAKAAEVGNMLGADGVIIGTVDEYSTVAYRGAAFPVVGITVRLIDCKSGKVMWSVDLAKRTDSKSVTLSEHARVVVHEMTAGLYQKWGVQRKVARSPEPVRGARADDPDEPVGRTAVPMEPEKPPSPPSGVTLSDMGLREVTITWEAPSDNASEFKIERADKAEGPFTLLRKVSAGRGKFVDDEGLDDSAVYYYRLTAVSGSGLESRPSDVRESMTAPPPEPPAGIKAEAHGSRAVQVTWSASPSEGVVRYIVERNDPDAPDRFVQRCEVKGMVFHEGETPQSDLKDATKYLYRVTSINRVDSTGQPSTPVEVETEPPPEPVKGLQASDREVRCVPLSWDPNPEPDIVRYDIYRKDGDEIPARKIASVKAHETKYLDGGKDPGNLEDNHTYSYAVVAVDAVTAESKSCSPAAATTREPPPVVEGVAAEFGRPREVPVTWSVSPDEKVVGYDILRAGPDSDNFTVVATVNGRETAGYVDKGGAKPNALGRLADGTEYRYQVVAFNTARAGSEPSEIAKAKSKFSPMAPIDLAATTNLPKSVVITWSPNAEMDIKEYVVESAAAGTIRFREITRVPVSQDERITATETKLSDGVGRVYHVKAIDADTLESPWSDPVEGATKPLPTPPTDVKAELNDRGALLTWTPPPLPDIRQYKVWKKGFIMSDLLTETESSEYQLSSTDVGKKLVVTISAVDEDGLESERTAPVEIRPPAPAK